MKKENVLIQIEDVRIRKYNAHNVIIEEMRVTFNPFEDKDEPILGWHEIGFYSTVYGALRALSEKEILIDEGRVFDYETYLKAVEESNGKILEAIEKAKKFS